MLACGFGLGIASTTPALAAGTGNGGAYSSVRAKITSVQCLAGCSGFESAKTGSVVRVRGSAMDQVAKIVFLGRKGAADDVKAKVSRRTASLVEVVVPANASSGRLRAINADGLRSRASKATIAIKLSGSGTLDARVTGQRVFLGASRKAQLDVLAQKPVSVSVTLTRLADGAVVGGWQLGAIIPGVVHSLSWDGTFAGAVQPIGRYEFAVMASGAGYQAASLNPVATGVFDLVDHKFPVRGKHNYGQSMAAFGAGRGGHSHQGHDVFAKCGTPLVAARGGVVKLNKFQSAAGNYLVIDADGTDVDYVYMHLRERSPVKKGTHVGTGQLIGRVGDTGRANGCHLHFEMWDAPGWYTGGKPFDPLPFLKAWDKYS